MHLMALRSEPATGTLGRSSTGDPRCSRRSCPFILAGTRARAGTIRAPRSTCSALGDEAGRVLGAAHPAVRACSGILAVTLLCGAAIAAAGPIIFVGALLCPHIARMIHGARIERWVFVYSVVLAPILLLAAMSSGASSCGPRSSRSASSRCSSAGLSSSRCAAVAGSRSCERRRGRVSRWALGVRGASCCASTCARWPLASSARARHARRRSAQHDERR